MKILDVPRSQLRTIAVEGPLRRLMDRGDLHPVFQPVVDLRTGAVFGHEALIRGPDNGPLHMPAGLLRLAARESLSVEFELCCVDVALRRWGELGQTGRLFVNMSADVLIRAMDSASPNSLERMLSASGVSPRIVAIEITEYAPTGNRQALQQAVKALHSIGSLLALDDFGEGHSNLRLWADLRPDFVKIDKFFTRSIATQAENFEVVRAIRSISEAFGTQLVAEGIANSDDLRVLRDLDIAYGQGYLLGRPQKDPLSSVPPKVKSGLDDKRIAVMPNAGQHATAGVLRGLPIIQAPGVDPTTTNEEVSALFQQRPELHALAVIDEGRPIALINRQEFMNRYARLYFREVHGRKPAAGYANCTPRVVQLDDDVDGLVGILTSEDQRYLTDGFIITEGGNYLGLGTGDQLVRAVIEKRIEAARHANPLTFLPGNIPISMHIERLLASGADFVACYLDLNDFKPFNDHYGYWRGDEVIRAVGKLAVSHCDARRDFVGHVGGDDFIVLFQSADWDRRCRRIIDGFAKEAPGFYDEAARLAGGIEAEDRHGVRRVFGVTSLSIGAVRVAPGVLRNAEDVASEAASAKHEAKLAASGFAMRVAGPAA